MPTATPSVTVRGIIVHDSKLFMVRQREHDGTPKNWWATPGGKLDIGESLHDCLRRELVEELGVTPVIGNLLYVQQFRDMKKQTTVVGGDWLEFMFHIQNADDFIDIDLAATTHGVAEIAEVAFVDPATVELLPQFLPSQLPISIAGAFNHETRFFYYDD